MVSDIHGVNTAANATAALDAASLHAQQQTQQQANKQATPLTPVQATHAVHAAITYNPPLRIRPIDAPTKWLAQLDGDRATGINALAQQVMQQLRALHTQQVSISTQLSTLLALCQQDAARLAVVLRHAKDQHEKQRDRQALTLITQAETALNETHSSEINAGLNTADSFSMYTNDGELLQQMRNTYYNSIISKRSVNALFNAVADLLGEERLPQAMAVMQSALNADLLSAYPSGKVTPQLSALMSDAAIVSSLTNLFTLCRDFLRKIRQFVHPTSLNTADFTRRVVNMATSSFYLRELQRLNQDAVGNTPKTQLVFLNYYYALLKRLPNVLWTDLQQRNNTLLSVLRFMDQLTLSTGDFAHQVDSDTTQEAIKAKLIMQAGVPSINTAPATGSGDT